MKPFNAAGQSAVFLTMAYIGFGAALLCDLTAPFRKGRLSTIITDVVVMLIVAAVFIAALVFCSKGMPRLYAFLGAVWGATLYHAGLRVLLRVVKTKFMLQIRNQKEIQRSRRNDKAHQSK